MPLGVAAITERTPVIAYLGLGANLGAPEAQLQEALERWKAICVELEEHIENSCREARNHPNAPDGGCWKYLLATWFSSICHCFCAHR